MGVTCRPVATPCRGTLTSFDPGRNSGSGRAAIAPGDAVSGQRPLPQLELPGAEGPGAAQQVVAPHAVEALPQLVGEARPGGFEIAVPGHQGPVVVGAEVVDVLHHEQVV